MKKFVPYEKLSKKEQKAWNARSRAGWGEMNPVTRRTKNPAAYDRNAEKKKARTLRDDVGPCLSFCHL